MYVFDRAPLRAIGLSPLLLGRAQALFDEVFPAGALGAAVSLLRITEVHRESYRLHDGRAGRVARAHPRLLHELADRQTAIAVGDWVLCMPDTDGAVWIRALVPPLNHLVRRDADGRRHAVVSNVDTALLVMGLDDDFNLRRLERYLALVQGSGLPAVVVLTKADVAALDPRTLAERMTALRLRLPGTLDVVMVDGRLPAASEAVAPWLAPGRTVVLLGSSGAGKSTLTNTLAGRRLQDTGAVRGHDSRGKHTTTTRSLFLLPGGACVIDTPGLRALRPDLDEAALGASFGDIGNLAPQCRFRNCGHGSEPGCAVREGVDADRLRNYEKLLRESRRDQLNAIERRQQLAQWKARGREGEARAKHKRGEW